MDTPEKSQQPSKLVNEKIPPKSKGKKVSTAYSIVTPTTTIIQGPPIIEDATKSENTLENSQPEAPNDSTSPDVDDGSGSATDVETGGSSCDSETAAPVPPIPNPMGLKNQKYVATFNKIHEKLIACEKGRKVGRSTAPVDAAQATSQVTKAPTQEVQNSAECVEPPMKPQDPSKGKKKVTVSRKAGGPEKIVQQKVIANEAVASTLTTAAPENSKPAAKTQGPSGSPQKPAGPRPLDGQVKLENSIGEASIDNAAQVSSSHGAALTDGVAPPPAADPEPTPSVTSSDYNEPLPGFGLESTECPGLLACTHGIFQAHLHEPPVMPEQSRTFLEVESKLLGVLRHYQSIVDPLPSTVAFIDGLQTTHVKLVALASERISNIVAVMAAAVLWRTWNWLDILAQGKDLEITVASLDSVKSTLDEIELLYMCDNVGFDPWWGGFGQWLNEDYRNIPGKSTENPEYEEK
ncbi:hypothetical protein EDC01DRAFT_783233 [Geopyxis carbonaria]|nr:hypothetical protein EDC01DRAFT_783233 [Geopyxis carbonaria]